MRVGIDLDNTIICYDDVFHRVARRRGWLDAACPAGKSAVKAAILGAWPHAVWTELQGLVYGEFLSEATPYDGALAFIAQCRSAGWPVSIISHKTQFPAVGKRVDLRLRARRWLADRGLADELQALVFCDTRAEKVARIAVQSFDLFIDDLPEVFREAGFPAQTARVLFDPTDGEIDDPSWTRCVSWAAVHDHVFGHDTPSP